MGGGDDYECPECGGGFPFGTERCPDCGVEMEWDDAQGVEIGREPLTLTDPRLPREEVPAPGPEAVFSRAGLACVLLTAVAFVGTVVLMRWDTWVRGAAEDVIGDDQRMLIYAGAVATTVLALMAILDILRGPGRKGIATEAGD